MPRQTAAGERETRRPNAAAGGGTAPERTGRRAGAACGDAPNHCKKRKIGILIKILIHTIH